MEDVELNEGGDRGEDLQDGCWKAEGKNKDSPHLPMAVGMGPDKELWERFKRAKDGFRGEEGRDPIRELWERFD